MTAMPMIIPPKMKATISVPAIQCMKFDLDRSSAFPFFTRTSPKLSTVRYHYAIKGIQRKVSKDDVFFTGFGISAVGQGLPNLTGP
jgi:hypothetical protein